jgi:transcription elongation factor Elf1
MNVEKKNMVTIPSHTYLDYYRTKSKYMSNHKCPKCGKKSTVTFKVEQRILSALCSSCTFQIRILEDTYITYDEHAMRSKQAYENSIDAILRAKFDLLFDYHSSSNIEQLRKKYLEEKVGYDQLYIQWEHSDPNHPQLKKDRDELIAKIKVHNTPEKHVQLNEVLDQLHKLEYTIQYNEVVPTPVYDLEIRTLDEPVKRT